MAAICMNEVAVLRRRQVLLSSSYPQLKVLQMSSFIHPSYSCSSTPKQSTVIIINPSHYLLHTPPRAWWRPLALFFLFFAARGKFLPCHFFLLPTRRLNSTRYSLVQWSIFYGTPEKCFQSHTTYHFLGELPCIAPPRMQYTVLRFICAAFVAKRFIVFFN